MKSAKNTQNTTNNLSCHSRENGNPAKASVWTGNPSRHCEEERRSNPLSPNANGLPHSAPLRSQWQTHHHRPSHGFTLVELIVVITILVILGTIAFTSLSGFAGGARDSSRVSDLSNLSQGLELTSIKTGSYPNPDSPFSVTYSGGLLWTQGTVGDTVINILGSAGAKFSRKPMDPLTTTTPYTYSKLAYGNAYQLKTDWEGDSVAYRNNLISQTYASSGNPTLAYIKGTYNGMVAKTQSGSTIFLLAVPSIITTQSGALDPTKFLIHGQTNSGGLTNAVNVSKLLIYSSGSLPSNDTEAILFASGIALAYSGTALASQSNIASFITALGNTGTLATLGAWLLSASLGGSASASYTPPPETPTISVYSGALTYTATQQFSYNGATVTVSGTWVGTSSTKADSNCNTNDIVIWSGDSVQIWAACNVGANTAHIPATHGWTGTVMSTILYGSDTEPNRIAAYSGVINSATNFLGNYYQWGRNDPVSLLATGSTKHTAPYQIAGITLNTGNGFILGTAGIYTWIDDASHNSSSGTLWTNTTNAWPCPVGYHLPTTEPTAVTPSTTDWRLAAKIIVGTDIPTTTQFDTIRSVLKLPLPGYRNNSTGVFVNQGSNGYYWSSSPYSASLQYAHYAPFNSGGGNVANGSNRAFGFSARCLKN